MTNQATVQQMDEAALLMHFESTVPTEPSALTDQHYVLINEFCCRLPKMRSGDVHFVIYNGNYGVAFNGKHYKFSADKLTGEALHGIIRCYYSDLVSNRHIGTC